MLEAVECGGCRGGGGDSVVVPPGGLLGVVPVKPPFLLVCLGNSLGVSLRAPESGVNLVENYLCCHQENKLELRSLIACQLGEAMSQLSVRRKCSKCNSM